MSVAASFKVIDGWCEMPGDLLFAPILYNENAYIGLKDYHSLKTFLATDETGRVMARMRLARTNIVAHWVSLPNAPFGGIESMDQYDVSGFLSFVKAHFNNDERLEIKAPPDIYGNPNLPLTGARLVLAGEEINHHVDLTSDIPLHSMEKRRIRKALKAGCQFREWPLNVINGRKLHDFISKCREAQGLQININEQDFLQAIDALPFVYQAYTVELEGQLIAATILVNVTNNIVYNYLPASDKHYSNLSPMVLLMNQLYEELISQGVATLDWGVSSIDGEEQKSLARFKEAMGAIRTEKRIFVTS